MNGRPDDIDIRLDFETLVYNNISTGIEHWMMSKALIFRAGKLKIKRSRLLCFLWEWKTRLQYHWSRDGRYKDHNICLWLEDLRILPFVYEWKTDIHLEVVDLKITAEED